MVEYESRKMICYWITVWCTVCVYVFLYVYVYRTKCNSPISPRMSNCKQEMLSRPSSPQCFIPIISRAVATLYLTATTWTRIPIVAILTATVAAAVAVALGMKRRSDWTRCMRKKSFPRKSWMGARECTTSGRLSQTSETTPLIPTQNR